MSKIKSLFMATLIILTFSLTASAASDELKIGVVGFVTNLEPTDQYNSWTVMRFGAGEALVRLDNHMNPKPWLAESWSLADDKLTWTFKIKEGVKFSNGRTMTAEAVKNSLERTFETGPRAKASFFVPEWIRTENGQVIIKTTKPTPNLPGCMADPLFLIIDTSSDPSKIAMEGPICTGPYKFESFSKSLSVMARNEYFWGGQTPFAKVRIQTIDDTNVRSMSLQAGEIDFAVNIAASDLDLFKSNRDFDVHEISSLRVVLSFINYHGPLADKNLRRAMVQALNREAYAKHLLHNTFTLAKGPIPPSLDYGFEALKETNPYSIEAARKLLAESGYKDMDGDGFVEDKDGRQLVLRHIIYSSRAELPLVAEASQADLAKIGLKVKIENLDFATLGENQAKGNFDMSIGNAITANTGDPEHFLREYWKTRNETNRNSNHDYYSNAEVDRRLDELSVEFDRAKRREIIMEIQQILIDDAASFFYVYPKTNVVSNQRLVGVHMFPADYYWVTKDIRPAKK